VLSPPDKCPSGSEPRPSRQRRLKFVSSKPPFLELDIHYDFLTRHRNIAQEPAEGPPPRQVPYRRPGPLAGGRKARVKETLA
jgi:hypothetical protein